MIHSFFCLSRKKMLVWAEEIFATMIIFEHSTKYLFLQKNEKRSPLKLSEKARTTARTRDAGAQRRGSCWLITRHCVKKGYKIEDCIKSSHCNTFLFSQMPLWPISSWLFLGRQRVLWMLSGVMIHTSPSLQETTHS